MGVNRGIFFFFLFFFNFVLVVGPSFTCMYGVCMLDMGLTPVSMGVKCLKYMACFCLTALGCMWMVWGEGKKTNLFEFCSNLSTLIITEAQE